MLPVRIEMFLYDPNKVAAEPTEVRVQSDIREVAPGVWFPFKSKMVKGRTQFEAQVTELAFNSDDIKVPGRVDFPPGASVRDAIAKTGYIVGGEEKYIESNIADVTETVNAINEGQVSVESSKTSRFGCL